MAPSIRAAETRAMRTKLIKYAVITFAVVLAVILGVKMRISLREEREAMLHLR